MGPRTKKLILMIVAGPVMLLYIGLVLMVADHVPDHWALQLPFYVLAGTVWAFPLKPVFGWANSPAPEKPHS